MDTVSAALKIENISKSFDGVHAVDGVSLAIQPGRVTAIIGPNGAGKTTLFNLITGFLRPDAGTINLNGRNITRMPPYKIARLGVARTFQNLRLIRQMTVLENVLLARPRQRGEACCEALFTRWWQDERKHNKVAMNWLEFVGLADKAHERAEALSYGQQKLLAFACCLAFDADWLLLDEPVAGVEAATVERLVEYIRQLSGMNRTVIFIEHNLEVVQRLANWVVVMDEGKVIAEGEWDKVSHDAEVLEAYLA